MEKTTEEYLKEKQEENRKLDKYFKDANESTTVGEHLYTTNVLLNILINVIENK